MEFLSPASHIGCHGFQRFVIETLGFPPKSACTCLANDRDILCQRYPDLAAQIVGFYAQADEFRQALQSSAQNTNNSCERGICVDPNESTAPDSIDLPSMLDSRTALVERDDSLSVSVVEHDDCLDVNYNHGQLAVNALPVSEIDSEIFTFPLKDVDAANDEENSRNIAANHELSDPSSTTIIPSHMTVHADFQYKSSIDRLFDIEPNPETDMISNPETHIYGIGHTLDTSAHSSPGIGFGPSSPEEQGLWQQTTFTMGSKGMSVEYTEEKESKAYQEDEVEQEDEAQNEEEAHQEDEGEQQDEAQHEDEAQHAEEGEHEDGAQHEDGSQQEDSEENLDLEEANDDDYESQTSSASPTPARPKNSRNSARRTTTDTFDKRRLLTSRKSSKRPLDDTGPIEPPSKRSKPATYLGNEPRTPRTNTTSTDDPSNQSFWDEWDMKRAAMTNHNHQTFKAVRVWERLSIKYSSRLLRSQRGQGNAPPKVGRLVTMVAAVANCYAFTVLKEVMGRLQQQDIAAGASDIFSNDPKVLMETVSTIELAGHLQSYVRRFTLARLANMYLETAANGGYLITQDERACLSSRTVVTNPHKAKAYVAMIFHIWGIPFPPQFKGVKMTRGGLIDSTAADAVRWNKCKTRLRKQIDAGQRWLGLATRVGWPTLALITTDWSIGESTVAASDRM